MTRLTSQTNSDLLLSSYGSSSMSQDSHLLMDPSLQQLADRDSDELGTNHQSLPEETPSRHAKQLALYEYPSSTPVKRRITSYHPTEKRGGVNARRMGDLLAIELENKPTAILGLSRVVFPDSSLPFAVDDKLLESLVDVWNQRKKLLRPPKSFTEIGVQTWLNGIAKSISSAAAVQAKRAWTAQYSDSILSGGELNRKPDIVLIDQPLAPIKWSTVNAVAEVTSRPKLHSEMRRTINNKTYLMFSTQHSRRFVPFLAICNSTIHFIVTDRQGQTIEDISYRQPGEHHALSFIRIIAALMFASDLTIGYDPTAQMTNGVIQTISAGGNVYAVKSTIHAARGVVGRSTRVWSVSDSPTASNLVIVKDGWIHEGRANAEQDHLKVLKGIRSVPNLIWGGTVQISNPQDMSKTIDDDTAWIRQKFSDGRAYRIHRRLVLSPVGEALSTFTSLGELVAALRDVAAGKPSHGPSYLPCLQVLPVIAHKACCERGILHRCIETSALTTFFSSLTKVGYTERHARACLSILIMLARQTRKSK